jgi:hypothetical protein
MLISYKRSQGSIVLRVKIRNSSVSTGAGLTGLTSASSGLIISTIADNEASATAYTVAGSTVETIATLGTFAAPTATKCRFKEVDATNHKGVYEIQIADARFAVSSAKSLLVSISGATNAAECDALVPLTDLDPYDAVRLGITALPNAAAAASGGLLISGSNTGTTTFGALTCTGAFTVSGGVVVTTSGTHAVSLTGNGSGSGILTQGGATGHGLFANGGVTSGNGAQFTGNGNGAGFVCQGTSDKRGMWAVGNGTAVGFEAIGGSTSAAGFAAIAGGGNAAGMTITGVGSGAGLDVAPGATGSGVKIIGGSTSGVGIAVTTTSGDGISVLPTAGNGLIVTANGTSKHGFVITGGTAGTSDGVKAVAGTGGVPIRGDLTGNITGALSGAVGSVTGAVGSVTGAVGSVATGGITTASFAAGAIDAAAIATDAIGALELAAGAASEVAAAVWDLATSGHTTSGTFGAAMNAAGSAGDPWSTSVPGAYGAGTAGFILGTNLNATISSRLASSGDALSVTSISVSGNTTFTGTTTHTGNVSYAAGIIVTNTTTNGHGITSTGNGTGQGISATGGATGAGIAGIGGASGANGIIGQATVGGSGIRASGGTTGHGLNLTGGTTSGNGVLSTGGPAGAGISAVGGSTSGTGLSVTGTGSGSGFNVAGGATGHGLRVLGGSTSGSGFRVTVTSGLLFDLNSVELDAYMRTAMGLATANLDTQLGTIDDFLDTEVAAIKAKTDLLPSVAMLIDSDGRLIVDAHKLHWTIVGTTQTIYRLDGTTSSYTKTLATDAAALPITGN